MADKITFDAIAGDDIYNLFSSQVAASYLNQIAAKIDRHGNDILDDNELTKDEFISAMAGVIQDPVKATSLFDAAVTKFGETVDANEAVAFWEFMAEGINVPSEVGVAKTLQLAWKQIGAPKTISINDTQGIVVAHRALIPFGGNIKKFPPMPSLAGEDPARPVHLLRCTMQLKPGTTTGITAEELQFLIQAVDKYPFALVPLKEGKKSDTTLATANGCQPGESLFYSLFFLNRSSADNPMPMGAGTGANMICMSPAGPSMTWRTRTMVNGQAHNLNDLLSNQPGMGMGTIPTNVAGSWKIVPTADGTINIEYYCLVELPLASSDTVSNAMEGMIYENTLGLFGDIFDNMAPVYIAAKQAMTTKLGRVPTPQEVCDVLLPNYNIHEKLSTAAAIKKVLSKI